MTTLADLNDLRMIAPLVVDDTAMAFASLAETDYTAWSGATAYIIGDRAMITGTTHRNYECVLGHTNKTPLDAANIYDPDTNPGGYWIVVGATNRWKAFDQRITDRASYAGNIKYRILLPTYCDTVAIFGLAAGGINVRATSPATPRRNLLTRSEEFDHADWTKTRTTVTNDLEVSPEFSFAADRLIEDGTAASTHLADQSVSFTTGLAYTFSLFVRRGDVGTRNVRIDLPASAFTSALNVVLDLGTGVIQSSSVGTTVSVDANYFLGWYRLILTATATATAAGNVAIRMLDASYATSYDGDSASRIDIWGAQVEQAATATDYQYVVDAATWDLTIYQQGKLIPADQVYYTTEAVFQNIPAVAGDSIVVELYATGGTARVGEIVIGQVTIIGRLQGGPASLHNFSSIEEDTFGNVDVVPRKKAKTFDYSFVYDCAEQSRIISDLEQFLDVPVVTFFASNTEDFATTVYGYIKAFDLPLEPVAAQGTLSIRGLSQ